MSHITFIIGQKSICNCGYDWHQRTEWTLGRIKETWIVSFDYSILTFMSIQAVWKIFENNSVVAMVYFACFI